MRVRGVCTIAGCIREHYARGWCTMHYSRWLKKGSPDKKWAIEPVGWYVNSLGYRLGTITDSNLLKLEHVYLAEKALGKPLLKGVEVHHVNGNPSDNTTSYN